MTSAHSMQPLSLRSVARSRLRLSALVATLACMSYGCSMEPKLEQPQSLNSPYERTQLWAVAPFANESGVSIVKTDRVADMFVEQAEQIRNINTVPVNRVLLAMHRLGLKSISSPTEALTLMNVLAVDGLIVGTVTAFDPYNPPKLGVAIQLYRRDSVPLASTLDPVQVSRAANERVMPAAVSSVAPTAQASGVFDARNHEVLMWLDQYAIGRTSPGSSLGKKMYLVNMELYTQFVAYRLMHDLLQSEQARLTPPATQPTAP